MAMAVYIFIRFVRRDESKNRTSEQRLVFVGNSGNKDTISSLYRITLGFARAPVDLNSASNPGFGSIWLFYSWGYNR